MRTITGRPEAPDRHLRGAGRPAKPAEPEALPPELPDVHREAEDEDEFEPDGDEVGD